MTDQYITVFIWMDNQCEYTGDTPIGAFSWSVYANEVPTHIYLPMRIKLSKWVDSDVFQRVDLMETLIETSPRNYWFRPEEAVE